MGLKLCAYGLCTAYADEGDYCCPEHATLDLDDTEAVRIAEQAEAEMEAWRDAHPR